MTGRVNYRVENGVATIELDNPARRNAVTVEMLASIAAGVHNAEASRGVRVIVLTGAAGHFCAGADLTRFEEIESSPDRSDAVGAITRATKPTVAVIEGACVGGGAVIALACDLRYASSNARFGLPPSRLGILFPLATTKRIIDVVGQSSARDLLFSGRIVDAAEAARIGLVNGTFPPESFATITFEKIAAIAANSPRSISRAKAIIDLVLSGQSDDTAETLGWVNEAMHGPDVHEGQAAFREKRPPKFTD